MDSLRSNWQENRTDIWSFYCPQCKIPRRVPYKAKPGLKHYAQVGLTAVIFMLLTWTWFSWKGIVAFIPLWTVFEVIYRGRVRAALSCDSCGFDPVLYLVDAKRARRDIEDHWKKKFEEKGIPYPPQNAPGTQHKASRASEKPIGAQRPKQGAGTGIEEELANTRGSSSTQ
jgi:hypothetical protein